MRTAALLPRYGPGWNRSRASHSVKKPKVTGFLGVDSERILGFNGVSPQEQFLVCSFSFLVKTRANGAQ